MLMMEAGADAYFFHGQLAQLVQAGGGDHSSSVQNALLVVQNRGVQLARIEPDCSDTLVR